MGLQLKVSWEKEQGVYVVLTAVLIVGILACSALAVDASVLYLSAVRLQQAVDAGALVAGPRIGELSDDEVKELGADVVRENTAHKAEPIENLAIVAEVDQVENTLKLSATQSVSGMFFGNILEGDLRHEISASATIKQRQVAVIIVADRTTSMQARVRLPDGKSKTRAELFREAAMVFGSHFDDNDRVGIVSFAEGTSDEYDINRPFDFLEYAHAINGTGDWGGSTNLQFGILAGFKMLMRLEDKERYDLYMVIATDGVPNRRIRDRGQREALELLDWARRFSDADIDPEVPDLRTCHGGREERENYIAAQRAADIVRNAGVKVFAIAFGSNINRSATELSPWGTKSPRGIHAPVLPSYMRSLAFDRATAMYHRDIPFLDECVPSYELAAKRGHIPGVGITSNDPSSISGLMARIAGAIKLRLIT